MDLEARIHLENDGETTTVSFAGSRMGITCAMLIALESALERKHIDPFLFQCWLLEHRKLFLD